MVKTETGTRRMDMNDVARNLKRIRERRGMSQETVAAQLHTTRQTISNWERGQTNPSIDASWPSPPSFRWGWMS